MAIAPRRCAVTGTQVCHHHALPAGAGHVLLVVVMPVASVPMTVLGDVRAVSVRTGQHTTTCTQRWGARLRGHAAPRSPHVACVCHRRRRRRRHHTT